MAEKKYLDSKGLRRVWERIKAQSFLNKINPTQADNQYMLIGEADLGNIGHYGHSCIIKSETGMIISESNSSSADDVYGYSVIFSRSVINAYNYALVICFLMPKDSSGKSTAEAQIVYLKETTCVEDNPYNERLEFHADGTSGGMAVVIWKLY